MSASSEEVLAALRRRPPVDQSRAVSIEEAVAAAQRSAGIVKAAQPAATTDSPPPSTVDEIVERALAHADSGMCGVCGDPINDSDDRTVRGRCRHTVHTACLVPLLLAGRQYCTQCSPEASARTGYAVDTGNDTDMRVLTVVEALRLEREQVRDDLRRRLASTSDGHRRHAENVTLEQLMYSSVAHVPHKAGGVSSVALATRVCTSSDCGSATYCLHRHLDEVSRTAIEHWRHYVARTPLVGARNNVSAAKAIVHRLLDERVSPSEWRRLGVTAERLAAMGFTIDDVVVHHSILFEDVVGALELDWPRLESLNFHPSMMAARQNYPVVVLVSEPVHATARKLMHSFALGARQLLEQWRLTTLDVAALGFDATTLAAIGMEATMLIGWLLDDANVDSRGVAWWIEQFKYTSALHRRLFTSDNARMLSPKGKAIFAQLQLYTSNDAVAVRAMRQDIDDD